MKKYYVSLIVILLIVSAITSVTYAWFTYVERKSLATFEAGELAITMKANDAVLNYDLYLEDLAFIDYQNEVVLDKYQTFNDMASSIKIDIQTDEFAPLSRHRITIDESHLIPGLMYVIIYDGINVDPLAITTDYHTYVSNIISSYGTYEEQMIAIDNHNQQALNDIYQLILHPNDTLTLQLVMWGNYDALVVPENYLNETFILSLKVQSINDKGEITP